MNMLSRTCRHAVVVAAALWLALPASSFGGEWRVSPIKLYFGKDVKSGVVTVINEGTDQIHLQIKAMEWTQDGEGKDVYTETNDIVFFPKMMVLKGKEERVVRAGVRSTGLPKERTYRLFIEEIPEPKAGGGANITVAIKFGVPLFVGPLKEEQRGAVERAAMEKGVVTFRVANTGTVHMVLDAVTVAGRSRSGDEVFTKELGGWYVLHGASRPYSVTIPQEACKKIDVIEVSARGGALILKGALNVRENMCQP